MADREREIVYGELPPDEVTETVTIWEGLERQTIETFWSRIKKGDQFDSPRESEGRVEAIEDFGACDFDQRPGSVAVRQVGRAPGFFIAESEGRRVTVDRQVITDESFLL